MALLALGTWWLVKNTPRAVAPGADAPCATIPTTRCATSRCSASAPTAALSVQIEGTCMRHYPDTDTLEIDGLTIRALAPDGSVTLAKARQALSNGDGSEVQLIGGAQVVREGAGDGRKVEFESEFLHAFLNPSACARTCRFAVREGRNELSVGAIDYDNLARSARLGAPVRARFDVPPR